MTKHALDALHSKGLCAFIYYQGQKLLCLSSGGLALLCCSVPMSLLALLPNGNRNHSVLISIHSVIMQRGFFSTYIRHFSFLSGSVRFSARLIVLHPCFCNLSSAATPKKLINEIGRWHELKEKKK